MKTTKNEFLDSLILSLEYDFLQHRSIAAQRILIRDPEVGAQIQVHPDPNYRLCPVALKWHNNHCFVIINGVAKELLLQQEYHRYTLLLWRQRGNPVVSLWAIRVSLDTQPDFKKYMFKFWAKVYQRGLLDEEKALPEVRHPQFSNVIQQHRQEPELPPPWGNLPDMETLVKSAFRGRIISDIGHPALFPV